MAEINNLISESPHFLAFLGGVLPAFLWLWFWLHEDKRRPEPRGRIFAVFLAGMLIVPVAVPFQRWVADNFSGQSTILFFWALIEEILKFAAVWWVALRSRDFDEPIDAMIYFITVALGFSALENSLFIFKPLAAGDAITGLVTGNLRFMGAMLLHTLSSGTAGLFLALAFYFQKTWRRVEYIVLGVFLATLLHTVFNFFIINTEGSVKQTFVVFSIVWLAIIFVILAFERVKLIPNIRK